MQETAPVMVHYSEILAKRGHLPPMLSSFTSLSSSGLSAMLQDFKNTYQPNLSLPPTILLLLSLLLWLQFLLFTIISHLLKGLKNSNLPINHATSFTISLLQPQHQSLPLQLSPLLQSLLPQPLLLQLPLLLYYNYHYYCYKYINNYYYYHLLQLHY